jgi:hypothetical protein
MAEAEPLPDEAFKALMGRMPSEEERRRLAKVKDALGIRSADAIWEVMVALDYHLQLYTTIPEKIAGETRKAVDELRSLVDGQKRGRRHDPSISVPAAAWSPAVAAVLGAVGVAFGGICVAAGYLMAERGRPPWGAPGALGAVLGAPAGWLVFVLLLPAATRWVQAGWRAARSRQSLRVRAVGWGLIALSLATIAVGLTLLAVALKR